MSGGGALGSTPKYCVLSLSKRPNPFSQPGAVTMPQNGDAVLPGLARVAYVPRGAKLEDFDKNDMPIYRRALRWQRLRGAQMLLDGELVSKCFRTRMKPLVEVHHSASVGRAHYGGLCICSSVWMCPVCAAKITERRKTELEGANTEGLSKFMVTFTLQHKHGDALDELIDDLSQGMRSLKSGRWWQVFAHEMQIIGGVMGTEITVSQGAGFHPHKHALYFSRLAQSDIDAEGLREKISLVFEKIMAKRSRYVSPIFGVNVRAGDDVQLAYVAKMGEGEKINAWSLAAELTKSPVKTGRDAEHYHPFELIDLYLSGNRYAGKLFRQYAHTMKGRNQLSYSPGTRDLLGLDVEMSDEEIANMQEKDARLFALLSPDDWRLILQNERRGELLEVASTGDIEKFTTWMRAIGAHDFGKDDAG